MQVLKDRVLDLLKAPRDVLQVHLLLMVLASQLLNIMLKELVIWLPWNGDGIFDVKLGGPIPVS